MMIIILSAEYRLPHLAKTDPLCSEVSLQYLSYLFITSLVEIRSCSPDYEDENKQLGYRRETALHSGLVMGPKVRL